MQRIAQTIFDIALVAVAFHIDEVDHNQPAQVAQAQLAGNFFCCLKVGIERGGFDIRTFSGAC